MKLKLDDYEKDLLESYENNEWISVKDKEELLERHAEYAKAHAKKDKRINVRISERDLRMLKSRSLEEGLPYQSLVTSIIHKFLSGRLKESGI